MTTTRSGRIAIERILCPVDLSDISRHALDHAEMLAAWYGARLTVLHVRPFALPPTDYPVGILSGPELPVTEPDVVLKELEIFSQPPGGSTVAIDCRVAEGATVSEILRVASEDAVDLIVIGTHGRTGFDRLLLGSVAEAVLRKANCPVLTIPPRSAAQATARYRRVLCAMDFSPASRRALDHALGLAQEDDARLYLLHVNEWPAYPPAWYESAVKTDALRQAVMDAAKVELERAVPAQARDWCRVEEHVVTGRPHEEIVRFAEEHQVDLIVMGAHGRSAIAHAVFGSTTNQVVRHATCPVLSVRG